MLNKGECIKVKLCTCSLGIAIGITKGLVLMVLAWISLVSGVGTTLVEHLGSFYAGYASTWVGGLIGGAWGFGGGLVIGLLIASIYNFFFSRCCKKSCGPSCECDEKE